MKNAHLMHYIIKPEFNIYDEFPFNEYLSILQKDKNQNIHSKNEFEEQDTNKNSTIKPISENKEQYELVYDETNNGLIYGVKKMKLTTQWGKIIKELIKNNPLRVEVLLYRAFGTIKYKIDETINKYDRNRFDKTKCEMNAMCREILGIDKLIDKYCTKKFGLTVNIKTR